MVKIRLDSCDAGMHRDLLRSVKTGLASLRPLKPDLTNVTFACGVLRFASATPAPNSLFIERMDETKSSILPALVLLK